MSQLEEAKNKLGELLIVGFEGTELSDDTSAFLSQAGVGGVILFAENYENPEQLVNLTNSIQETRREFPLWISTDHEGGKVQRFKEPFSVLPSAQRVGATSPKIAFEMGALMAKELASVGINLNFAPCVDINTRPDNPIIGSLGRSFGADEDTVTKMATAVVRGHVTNGVQACVKHFPGHGDTTLDSHLDLPTVTTGLTTLKEREFRPFVRCFKSRCHFVMTAHIVFPELDPERPATLSDRVLTDLLRKEMRYSRIIISDDLEMEAITKNYGADEAPIMAIQAGCDMLIYRSESAARHAYEVLFKALEEGKISPERVLESANRVISSKKETLTPYNDANAKAAMEILGCDEHKELLSQIP